MRSLRRFMVLVPAIAVYLILAEGLYADTFQFSYSGSIFQPLSLVVIPSPSPYPGAARLRPMRNRAEAS
jgi:hypothetical protein